MTDQPPPPPPPPPVPSPGPSSTPIGDPAAGGWQPSPPTAFDPAAGPGYAPGFDPAGPGYSPGYAPGPAPASGGLAWLIVGLVATLLSVVGTFLPLVSVRGRSVDRSMRGIGIEVSWRYADRAFVTTLFERWDVAVAVLLLAAILAVVALAARRRGWLVGAAAVLAALGFHLQLGMLQRAERIGLTTARSVSYGIGGILVVGGALVALVSFIAVLAKRH